MKKWYVFLLICCLTILWNQNEKLELVFQENYLNQIDETSFEIVKIDVSDASITSKNITSLLNGLSLIKIEYEFPKWYQDKIPKSNNTYRFEKGSTEKELRELEQVVQKKWKQLGKQTEVERIYFYGIKIKTVEVCGQIRKIDAFKKQIQDW